MIVEKWPEELINQAPHEHTSRRKHKHGGGGDEGEGLWAVSYADLLMVLMSFFIVFFKVYSITRHCIIFSIVNAGSVNVNINKFHSLLL